MLAFFLCGTKGDAKMKTFFNCHSLRLAGFLMFRGFVMFEMKKDMNSRRNIFIFNNSDELFKAIEDYKKLDR